MGATTTSTRQRKLRIVLVEDDEAISELLEYFIRNGSFREAELIRFENGDAAWQELSRSEPDLLITDLLHPGIDGGEILRRLAEKQVKFPVLMTSGFAGKWFQDYTGLRINVAFLSKPFLPEQFEQALNDLLEPGRGDESNSS
jgi:DNA-binding response OmpR family regulator